MLRLVRGDQDEHHVALVVRRHLREQELISNQASFVKVFSPSWHREEHTQIWRPEKYKG